MIMILSEFFAILGCDAHLGPVFFHVQVKVNLEVKLGNSKR